MGVKGKGDERLYRNGASDAEIDFSRIKVTPAQKPRRRLTSALMA